MKERKITEDEIFQIFQGEILVHERLETIIIGKTKGNRYLTLIINPETYSLITLWPSNKRERALYIKKIGDKNEKDIK